MEYIYAALLLHKLGKEINENNLKSVISAAGVSADESKIKSLVASLKNVDIEKELEKSSMIAAAPPSGGASSAGSTKEEKKHEEKKEAAAEGLSALFG